MIALALLLQVALPRYDDLPAPPPAAIRSCAASYDRLQSFVARFKRAVFDRELNHGGRLTWTQGNDIRYAADLTARPYLEGIRRIAYTGAVSDCRRIADNGERDVIDRVIRPVFGR